MAIAGCASPLETPFASALCSTSDVEDLASLSLFLLGNGGGTPDVTGRGAEVGAGEDEVESLNGGGTL